MWHFRTENLGTGGRRAGFARRGDGHYPRPPRPQRQRPEHRHPGNLPHARACLVGALLDPGRHVLHRPDGHGRALGPGRFLGPPRVHHAHAHAARRPSHAVHRLLRDHALAVRARGPGEVSAVQHHDPRLCVSHHSRFDRHGGRLQAIPGADGEDRGRAVDLRLLPELRPGPLDAAARKEPGATLTPGPTPGCCSSSCSWSSSATPCNTPGPRSPAGT